ncbi:MAG: hypothetical protein ACI4RR_00205 [Eubacterium sp.]
MSDFKPGETKAVFPPEPIGNHNVSDLRTLILCVILCPNVFHSVLFKDGVETHGSVVENRHSHHKFSGGKENGSK